MNRFLKEIIDSYDPKAPLNEASTIPASWYTNKDLYERELAAVFSRSWQFAARSDQLCEPGQYVTNDIGGEPIAIVRGSDRVLRGFYNVCRHHAAAVMTEPEGKANQLRCPYHGWTYSLAGELKGTPDFSGVCNFDRSANGLVPIQVAEWENWVFVYLGNSATVESSSRALEDFPGADLVEQLRSLRLGELHWFERRHYNFDCNWKVFVDNYLDGGYHVPYLHK